MSTRALARRLLARDVQRALVWALATLLVAVKLAMVSDLAVLIMYGPHDDGLYVSRAYHLLSGGAFGPYDARVLVKLPGMSLWLAATRALGLPYLVILNVGYVAAGCYAMAALGRCGFGRWLLLLVFALYLFNPMTYSDEWLRVVRDPLSAIVMVTLFAAVVFAFAETRDGGVPWVHGVVFASTFAFALLLREEDVLLYGALGLFAALLARALFARAVVFERTSMISLALLIALPLGTAFASNRLARAYIDARYGAPLLHDFSEGEFPKLIAAMRSVDSAKENRLVMITQEALGHLRKEVPALAPLIERLPPPGPETASCKLYGVCSEWVNGWMLFWIKDAAFSAGLTPTLPAAQSYFRSARLAVEQACRDGKMKCSSRGAGLVPAPELRWLRSYFHEFLTLARMTLVPALDVTERVTSRYDVDADYGRMYQEVTMTHHGEVRHAPAAAPRENIAPFDTPLRGWRSAIADGYLRFGWILMIAAIGAFLVRVACWRAAPLDAFAYAALVALGYLLLRLVAMSYVLAHMGQPEQRVMFSTEALMILLSPLLIADGARALARAAPWRGLRNVSRTDRPAGVNSSDAQP